MIRPFRAEDRCATARFTAGESVYDHPFQWGSKRTGPDPPAWVAASPTSGSASTT